MMSENARSQEKCENVILNILNDYKNGIKIDRLIPEYVKRTKDDDKERVVLSICVRSLSDNGFAVGKPSSTSVIWKITEKGKERLTSKALKAQPKKMEDRLVKTEQVPVEVETPTFN